MVARIALPQLDVITCEVQGVLNIKFKTILLKGNNLRFVFYDWKFFKATQKTLARPLPVVQGDRRPSGRNLL